MRLNNVKAYLCHAARPSGLGDDYEKGLKPGTLLLRAVDIMQNAGIEVALCHTVPPDPTSELGKFMADKCYADKPGWPAKANALFSSDACYDLLNRGNEQVFACDGSYEDAIRQATSAVCLVPATSANAISMYLKAVSRLDSDGTIVDGPHCSHPILKHINDLYPTMFPDGRGMDIWNPAIIDVLEYFYRGNYGIGRNIGGMWLTLGGPFLWGEASWIAGDGIYPVRTPWAKAALGRDTDIDMAQDEGRHYSAIIVARLGRLAVDLVDRLKGDRNNFYFQTRTFPRSMWKAGVMSAGLNGIANELCERFANRTDVCIHLVMSHAWDCSALELQNAIDLKARYPQIDFIGGVGDEHRLRYSGMSSILRWGSCEVQMGDEYQWKDLPAAMAHLQKLGDML